MNARPEVSLKYNKFYIGLSKREQARNFVILRPKREWVRLEVRLGRSDELQTQLEEAGLDLMDYDSTWGRYRIRLARGDVKKHEEFLIGLLRQAYEDSIV